MALNTGKGQSQADGATRQFISITIGDEEYGVDIIAIREIRGWTPTTILPDSPAHMRGVIDLRGSVVPVLDLRARFGRGLTEAAPRHVIMVVNVDGRDVGILVDAVADILTVPADAIQPVPELEHAHAQRHDVLSGIVAVDGRMVALLDLEHLLDSDDADTAPPSH
ncbi:MAG TPA: chemotaxis protein CheW [Magnetospirillum sp.]|jgi:purine-binding chemotaxis protein CheW|nr:chemotaxis protein CheW [Magnetospirillum sp.]